MIIMNNDDNSVDHDDNATSTIKEEMDDDEDSGSTVSSPPLLPIRPTPTSLFQPFLPASHHPGSLGGLHQDSPHHHKPLPFSIDNILRPTFGGQTATAAAANLYGLDGSATPTACSTAAGPRVFSASVATF